MVFLLAVCNYRELIGGLDIMTWQLVGYINNVYVFGEHENTVYKKHALLDASVNVC
jgi:hypothetical protein